MIAVVANGGAIGAEADYHWPQWRGPLGTGVAPYANPPVEWSESESDHRNIRWKTELPGLGHSTPIVWGDRIFITTAIPYGDRLDPIYNNVPGAHDNLPITQRQRFVILAVRRSDGKIVWQQVAREELPHEGGHFSGSQASSSPVTDGEHLLASFGSHGLYSYSLDGDLQWTMDFGKMQTIHAHGEGSSPVLYGETIVVNWDHEGQSFLVALDKRTGQKRWKVSREEVTSWSTPVVVEEDGRAQVIVSGTNRIRGYDLGSGHVIWECGGLSRNIVASPVSADGMVYAGSSYDTSLSHRTT